jgi:hypothetical protein
VKFCFVALTWLFSLYSSNLCCDLEHHSYNIDKSVDSWQLSLALEAALALEAYPNLPKIGKLLMGAYYTQKWIWAYLCAAWHGHSLGLLVRNKMNSDKTFFSFLLNNSDKTLLSQLGSYVMGHMYLQILIHT